jgi:hypothetical protein
VMPASVSSTPTRSAKPGRSSATSSESVLMRF